MRITGVKPWLIKTAASYWGEFLFVEVTTDEDVSGWGEITTTTRLANRALCAMLRQIGTDLVGEDPAHIERVWHKIFRSFTYMGSRGAAVECARIGHGGPITRDPVSPRMEPLGSCDRGGGRPARDRRQRTARLRRLCAPRSRPRRRRHHDDVLPSSR